MGLLTKQEAIQLHRKMWNWIADETEKKKKKVEKIDYFREMNIPVVERPANNCYCCEYNNQRDNFCNSCPIDWDSMIYTNKPCLNMFEDEDNEGLYAQWDQTKDYQESSKLARQIANLPEFKYTPEEFKYKVEDILNENTN